MVRVLGSIRPVISIIISALLETPGAYGVLHLLLPKYLSLGGRGQVVSTPAVVRIKQLLDFSISYPGVFFEYDDALRDPAPSMSPSP